MTIETKFNRGDKVYVLHDGFIKVAFVIKIIVRTESDYYRIQYQVQIKDQEQEIYYEHETHATKEDLCKHISMYVN